LLTRDSNFDEWGWKGEWVMKQELKLPTLSDSNLAAKLVKHL